MIRREKLCLDKGWQFQLGDPKPPQAVGHQAIYMGSKSERGRGLASRDYYDADFETVDLPHDYQILQDYDKTLQGSHGYLPRENAWYRRSFFLEEADLDKRITLLFDGVATNCTIWVNGHLMERNFCGYNAMEMDITDVLRPVGEANVIAVRVIANNQDFEGWWYEGAGIYRHVWLQKTNKIAVSTWGTYAKPVKNDDSWTVEIETEVINRDYETCDIMISHCLQDANGTVMTNVFKASEGGQSIVEPSSVIKLEGDYTSVYQHALYIEEPTLWDLDNPVLYNVITQILRDGKPIDSYITPIGFRTIDFDADRGFFLNGQAVKVKGVCVHQDHGGLGVAVPEQIWEYRIKKLKAMGCNAYRTGHTPLPTEFLNLCDQYGLLVMDESRWFDNARIGRMHVENMVKKDRNHPSVFMWCVGNEEPVQSTDVGYKLAGQLKGLVKSLDDTRPVTVALNGGFFDSKVSKASDVVGINYNFRAYDKVKELLPNHPVCSPEVGATRNARSVYFDDAENGRYVAYDDLAAPFGSIHRKAWEEVVTRDFVLGMFIWAGFEYRGESQWPKLYAGGGMLDSSGYEKDNYYLMKALWTEEPMLHLMPHWNLDVDHGTEIKVMTYTNCKTVELILNGCSLGKRDNDPIYQLEWQVPYNPGTLEAIAYDEQGEVILSTKRETVAGPYNVSVEIDGGESISKDQSVLIFDVTIKDSKGLVAEYLSCDMDFEIEGLTLLGTGNGDPGDHDHNRKMHRKIFNGHCQVICRVNRDEDQGQITVKTKEYGSDQLELDTKRCHNYRMIDSRERQWKLTQWWKAPISENAIDLTAAVNTGDVNTWEPVVMSQQIFDDQEGYRHYYMNTKMPSFDDVNKKASALIKGISGKVQVKVEHNPNYWPLPEPKEIKQIVKAYDGKVDSDRIALDGFYKNEAVLLHVIVENKGDLVSSIESVEWIIQ